MLIYNLYYIYNVSPFLRGKMYLVIKKLMSWYSGILCKKIDLSKTTKCFAHYICSYIHISNNFLKVQCARILKVKLKISFTV